VVALAPACGSSPTAPGALPTTAPYATAVVVTSSASTLVAGGTATVRATATNSTGAPVAVTPTWESSDLAVATVDAAGLVTAASHGTVTITARHVSGRSGSVEIGVFPDLVRTWYLDIVSASCTVIEFANFPECTWETGQEFDLEFIIGSQSELTTTTMKVTGVLSLTSGHKILDGTVDTTGKIEWTTLREYHEWISGTSQIQGTWVSDRIGVFQVSADGDDLSGDYTKTYTASGYSDPDDIWTVCIHLADLTLVVWTLTRVTNPR